MMLFIIQTVLLAVAYLAFLDWRKQRKVWQLLCSIYMVLSCFIVGGVSTMGGAL
jgi:Ca2+/Na+ antiporter